MTEPIVSPSSSAPATAGEILKAGRMKQRLSISECAKRTHIAPRYLEALEENRWADLPSESHRRGFIELYARFLGVPAAEVLARYQESAHSPASSFEPESAADEKPSERTRLFYPSSLGQLLGGLAVGLLAIWAAYHLLNKRVSDAPAETWSRPRPTLVEPRLPMARPINTTQKIVIQAQKDSWLRVTENRKLLFEGILSAGSTKEWSGAGPFSIKMADTQAVSVSWNDQMVDVGAGARGRVNTIQLPPAR